MAYCIKTKTIDPHKTVSQFQTEVMRRYLTSKGFRHADTMKYKTLKCHYEAVRK